MTLLALEAVGGARGGRTLFSGLTLALAAGDAALVTGVNGAGKSTLIRIAAGLLAPAAGTVTAAAPRALLAEATTLDEELPLAAALRFWAGLDAVPDPAGRVAAALDALALTPLARVPVRLLSTGQRRRGALARVVATQAPIWLLDEPLNGLDTDAARLTEAIAAEHCAAGGLCVIASHQPFALPGLVPLPLAGFAA